MAFTVLPIAGVDLVSLQANNSGVPTFGPAGAETFGSDGKRYVFAKAGAAITASTATCSINASTFVATGSGGSYTSPASDMVSGDYAWFAATSV
jgi:hypothetical protein